MSVSGLFAGKASSAWLGSYVLDVHVLYYIDVCLCVCVCVCVCACVCVT